MSIFPAIVFGGPPHAGKSVLLRSVTQALHERNIPHYPFRACPDGEGNWSQESDQQTVQSVRYKGIWSEEFVRRACYALERRRLPFLVDVGGRPCGSQLEIIRNCTHAVLLLKESKPELSRYWERLCEEYELKLLARIYSRESGESVLITETPYIQGEIAGLVRGQEVCNEVHTALVERIATLFAGYDLPIVEEQHRREAPLPVLNLYDLVPQNRDWGLEDITKLLAVMPEHAKLALYGRAAAWVYGIVAGRADPRLFYQFDVTLDWVQPAIVGVELDDGDDGTGEAEEIVTEKVVDVGRRQVVLHMKSLQKRLDYFQPGMRVFPVVPEGYGVVLSGQLPFWLSTALVRLYKEKGAPWVGMYEPRWQCAVVVYSREECVRVGACVGVAIDR